MKKRILSQLYKKAFHLNKSISTKRIFTSIGLKGMLNVKDDAAIYAVLPFFTAFPDLAIGREKNPA